MVWGPRRDVGAPTGVVPARARTAGRRTTREATASAAVVTRAAAHPRTAAAPSMGRAGGLDAGAGPLKYGRRRQRSLPTSGEEGGGGAPQGRGGGAAGAPQPGGGGGGGSRRLPAPAQRRPTRRLRLPRLADPTEAASYRGGARGRAAAAAAAATATCRQRHSRAAWRAAPAAAVASVASRCNGTTGGGPAIRAVCIPRGSTAGPSAARRCGAPARRAGASRTHRHQGVAPASDSDVRRGAGGLEICASTGQTRWRRPRSPFHADWRCCQGDRQGSQNAGSSVSLVKNPISCLSVISSYGSRRDQLRHEYFIVNIRLYITLEHIVAPVPAMH